MFGPSAAGIIQRRLGNRAAVADAVALCHQQYDEKHPEYVSPFTDLHDLLRDLRRDGHRWRG